MPNLPQTMVSNQLRPLPTNRVTSTIPRPPDATYGAQQTSSSDNLPPKWEYPSPQQFYNALIRKGWNTPEEHVEAMVLIHNRLNEDAWAEILRWEMRFGGGVCEAENLQLVEFAGIHHRVTYKAQIYQRLRRNFPSFFIFDLPFDRHDWIVQRPRTGKKIRYVIDYYSMRKSRLHKPEFYLDVRPASDSIGNIIMKIQYTVEQFVVLQLAWEKLITHYYPYAVYMSFFALLALSVTVTQLVL
ncbi:cytochrome c and c1 heme-lyase [Amanita rubescens]|nr:cytochrome c and c1 heme-lyase [Amanita rubescens]